MAVSPMMKHYLHIKETYPGCVVFYRLGDFYEMFFDDAVKVSKMLDLTLTGKDCGLEERAPMCGIPFHAADGYIAKLVSMGEKVAVCEQLEDPAEAKGLVERDVIKVVTAGTITEDGLIDEKTNNFIMAVYKSDKTYSLAWADITTGQFYVKECPSDDLCDNLTRINPSEIICDSKTLNEANALPIVKNHVVPKFSLYKEYAFGFIQAEKNLKEQLNVLSLEAYQIAENKSEISAAGALIEYLRETQKHALININSVSEEKSSEFMTLDANAVRNLELTKTLRDGKRYGSLLWLLDRAETAMGSRALYSWLVNPLQDVNKINYRLNGVEELFNGAMLRQGISEQLKCIRDTERLSGKISNGNINPKDCRILEESLSALPNIKFGLIGVTSQILKDINANITDFTDLCKLLDNALAEDPPAIIKDGGYIKEGFDKELDRLRNIRRNGNDVIREIEERERDKTGIKNLKIGYNRVFGYYIEITNSFKEQVPYNYVRKQTLSNAERYITEELKQVEEDILTSDEKSKKTESEIFEKIKSVLTENIKLIQKSSRAVACLDALVSLSETAKKYNYVKPEMVSSDKPMNIVAGRHPVVEAVSGEQFVANDTLSDTGENRVLIITGPNMAGKSTYMRQNALIAIMAHIGSFVPAKSAEIPIIDRIFTRVGASDSLIFDQSTFMVEMTEVAAILLHATEKSLLILDEVGRGTSTYDGLSIAWSVVEYLAKTVKAKTLFATHYHELSELEGMIDGVKNYKITVKEINGSIVFLRKIMRGSANRSFGIEVAALAGVPKTVTERAKEILKNLEKNDIAKHKMTEITEETEADEKPVSETEKIIKDINLDNISPIQAFRILADLKEKAVK